MLRASGDVCELYVGYHKAADITKWNLTCKYFVAGQLDISFNGKVVAAHDFWSTQTPTALWLWMGQSWWIWSQIQLQSVIRIGEVIEIQAEGSPVVSVTRK